MSFLNQLYYSVIRMRRQPFSAVACPHCGTQATAPFIKTDRYFLPVHVAMCEACGLIHTSRNFSGDALYAFYRDHYRRFYESTRVIDDAYLYRHQSKLMAAYRLVRIREVVPAIGNVLEIGSGLGFFLDECRAAGIAQFHGLELGDQFRNYAAHTLGLNHAVSDRRFETIPRFDSAPDLMVMFHVFEHLEDPAGCLRWAASNLAPSGTLVIEVPDMTGDWSGLGIAQFHTAHRWYFTPVTLCNMLAANGFTPYFITRDGGDGIYPGNLRVFARAGDAGAIYPLPTDNRAKMLTTIRHRLTLKSRLRAARRLLMSAWRNR